MFSTEHSQNFSQILSIGAGDVFECLSCIAVHERVEVVYFVFFCQLIVDFQTCLEKIIKQVEFFLFPIESGLFCFEGFGQFRGSADVFVEIG